MQSPMHSGPAVRPGRRAAKQGHVVDLEEKIKTLKAEAIAIDAVLETTKKELAMLEEGFVEIDLDDQLGYGLP